MNEKTINNTVDRLGGLLGSTSLMGWNISNKKYPEF